MHKSEEHSKRNPSMREWLEDETLPSLRRMSSLDIVLQLQNILGFTIGEEIQKLVLTEDITTIVVWGVPGSGKTTVLEGIRQFILNADKVSDSRRRDNRKIELEIVSFDKLRHDFLQRLRSQGRNVWALKDLTAEEIREFDEVLTLAMTGPLPVPQQLSARVIRVVEVPAVGDDRYPRGQTGMKILGERAQANPKEMHTISIHILADAPVYVMAQHARQIATQCRDDYELKAQLYPLVTYLGPPEGGDVGKTLWLTQFRSMASSNQIMQILAEFDELVERANEEWERYSQQKKNAPTKRQQGIMSVHDMFDFINRNSSIPPGSEEDRLRIIKRYVYVMGMIMEAFHFPDMRSSLVAVNTAAYGTTGQALR